ncbi:cytochrome P450 2K1-like isoform X2 [Mauremys mutica]|uniref:cytochrome P450 2K1-like isoform X2 n=1 Tax=Mauremys mutica TaxID=74926 RepID=UPI001D15FC31|nr:cytochrome P450 2K1-like isoform X2 [Mauremys mutica]
MLVISEVLVALLISLFVVQFLKLKWACSRLPPGPTPLPLIGTIWQMDFKRQHEILIKLAQIYGNIFTLWIGHIPVIILNGFTAVKDSLTVHSEDVSGRPATPFFQKMAGGKGIIFTSGHTWKQQRRFGLMTLRNLGLGKKGLEHRIQEEARQLLEYFMNERGDPLDPSFPIVHSVSNVIAAVVFGHRFSIEDKDFHQLIENNNYLTKQGSSISELLYDIFSWLMDHLPGTHQKIFHCHEFLRSFARKEVRSHQERGSPDEPQDFIDFYLAQIDKAQKPQLPPCAGQCLIWWLTQTSKGTIILPNLISALLDPEHWETPRQFNPNHFLDQDGNFVNKEAFLAFSAGHRVCLGEQLARTELFIFFTNLLRAFTFRLPEGVKEINTESMLGGFLQPHPYKICAVPR